MERLSESPVLYPALEAQDCKSCCAVCIHLVRTRDMSRDLFNAAYIGNGVQGKRDVSIEAQNSERSAVKSSLCLGDGWHAYN